jgi:alkyl sulfatase BDS1-like metallo-beta-lactamase superfamily hydrolase
MFESQLDSDFSTTPTTASRRRRGKPRLIQVTDRVFCSIGYALCNVLYVITDKSVVIIDTTESPAAARASFDEFRSICQLPVSYIIYTHFHGDHIRGAKVFHTPQTKVIAQERMPEELAKNELLRPYRRRVAVLQYGLSLKALKSGITVNPDVENGYIPPDITFDKEHRFEEGGAEFQLFHTEGETFDHLMVWLPNQRVLFPGDLFYFRFPMLSSPMKPERPVRTWAQSLERMRNLHPAYLAPSHGKPLSGEENVDSTLANYARAIRYVHDMTVKLINQGLPLREIRNRVQLPKELARLPYLYEGYGTIKWAVNGIFHQYVGWYNLDCKDLNPTPRGVLESALLRATGGPEPLIRQAREALWQGRDQLALELSDILLGARPENPAALAVRVAALRRLGAWAVSAVERNIYRASAQNSLRRQRYMTVGF